MPKRKRRMLPTLQKRRSKRSVAADRSRTSMSRTTIGDRSAKGRKIKAEWRKSRGAVGDIYPLDTKKRGKNKRRARKPVR